MLLRTADSKTRNKDGFVLASVIFVVALLGVLTAASLMMTGDERQAAHGMREGTRAFYAAEAGLNVVIANFDSLQYDTLMSNPGDSVDLGWQTLPENGARYRAVIHRIDNGGQAMYLLNCEGRSAGPWGGQRVLELALTPASAFPPQAFAVNDNLGINGSPTFKGACPGVHANGALDVWGTLTVWDGDVSAVDDVGVPGGSIIDSVGNPVTPQSQADSVQVPQLDPTDYCGEADYFLRNGWVVDVAAADSSLADTEPFIWDGTKYTLAGQNIPPGTICADANVFLDGNPGTAAAPLSLSILAEGYIDVNGNPFIVPDHSEDISFIAGGDLHLNGNFDATQQNFDGLVYGLSQCYIEGSFVATGQVLCRGDPDPPGAVNLFDLHAIDGNPTLTYGCGISMIVTTLRPLGQRAWWQVMR